MTTHFIKNIFEFLIFYIFPLCLIEGKSSSHGACNKVAKILGKQATESKVQKPSVSELKRSTQASTRVGDNASTDSACLDFMMPPVDEKMKQTNLNCFTDTSFVECVRRLEFINLKSDDDVLESHRTDELAVASRPPESAAGNRLSNKKSHVKATSLMTANVGLPASSECKYRGHGQV